LDASCVASAFERFSAVCLVDFVPAEALTPFVSVAGGVVACVFAGPGVNALEVRSLATDAVDGRPGVGDIFHGDAVVVDAQQADLLGEDCRQGRGGEEEILYGDVDRAD